MPVWKFNSQAEERFMELLSVESPFSNEIAMGKHLRESWAAAGCDVSTDVLGNVYGSLDGTAPVDICLVAHMDNVALQITKIAPDGMILFRSVGLNPRMLPGQRVNIITSGGPVPGVVGFDPLAWDSPSKEMTERDLWIDTGGVSDGVEIGDMAVLSGGFSPLGQTYISGPGIDDKVGIFIIGECLRWFSSEGSPLNLHAIATVQEEMGLRGATAIGSHCRPDACFVLDVDFATDIPHASNEERSGSLLLGKGVGLHRKADNNPVLQRIVREAADSNVLPYQLGLGRRIYGGTDASTVQLQNGGIATVNINIPCRYMHSVTEICDTRDIETAVNLLIASIDRIAALEQKSFIPGID